MKSKEIRELSESEIEKNIRDLREELLRNRLEKETGQLEDTGALKEKRRDIARMETILNEKRRTASA